MENHSVPAIVADINAWDRQDITVLARHLRDLDAAIADNPDYAGQNAGDFVDMTSLPSADLEALGLSLYTHYPIWACDNHGQCLVGDREIESAESIRETYLAKG